MREFIWDFKVAHFPMSVNACFRQLRHSASERGKLPHMTKRSITPRGRWQATGMQRLRIPKDDPKKLRMRAEELKRKADGLVKEADQLIARAEQIEAGRT